MTDFTDDEVRHEQEMAELGQQRRRSLRNRLRERGRESLTSSGHALTRAAMTRTVDAIEDWLKGQRAEQVTRRPPAFDLLESAAPPAQLALLTLRCCLDAACRGASWQWLVHRVAGAVDAERAARWISKEHGGSWSSLRRNAAAVPGRAAGRLRRAAREFADQKGFIRWSIRQRLQAGGILAWLAERHAGILAVEEHRVSRNRRRLVCRLLPEVETWIAEADRRDEVLEPMYMPMLAPPGDWGPDQVGGYSTGLVKRQHLVKNRSKAIREAVAGADMPDVYAAVNALQATAWEVNADVLEVARSLWDAGERWEGLGAGEDEPMPPRPAVEDKPAMRDWMRRRFLVRRANLARASARGEAARILWLAGKLAPSGSFHFPQQLDFRGRVYPVPQYLQPQGPDLARGLLRFSQGAYIQLPPPDAFLIHGANCFGMDKLPLKDRIDGISFHKPEILRVYHDPIDCRWWQDTAEPWQFLAWCLEAGQLLEEGRVFTRVPCYVDGTNNGLQLLSLLLRDEGGGAATNCLPGGRRDVYQDVADGVTARLREIDDDTARGWLGWFPGGRMPRAAAKRPVMTLPYGVTRWRVRQYVAEWCEEEVRQGRPMPWEGAGETWKRVSELGDHLWAVIEATLGRALEAMRWLRGLSDAAVEAGVNPVWTAPTGFPVRQPYPTWRTRMVRTRLGERVRWIRHRRDAGKLDARRHRNGLPPNFVHSLDAAVLARTVARFTPGVPVSTIHDSFGTLAPHLADLGRVAREVVAETFSSDLLEDLRLQLDKAAAGGVCFSPHPPLGTLDPAAVLHSEYLFS